MRRNGAELLDLFVAEGFVPEADFCRFDGFLFSVFIGKEESASGQKPVLRDSLCACTDLFAIHIDGGDVALHNKDYAIPAAIGEAAVIPQVA